MRERFVDAASGLAEVAAGEGSPALAGVVGDHDGEPLIRRAGPQGGLAQPGVAHHRHLLGVDVGIGLEVVQRRLRPQAQAAIEPHSFGGGLGLAVLVEERVDAVLEAVVEVGIDVAVVDRGQAVAALEDPLDRPAAGLLAPGLLGGAIADDGGLSVLLRIQTRASVMPGSEWTTWLPPKFRPTNSGTGLVALFGR